MEMCQTLLGVSPDVSAEFISYYVKFTIGTAPDSPPYAAVWIKNTKRAIVGLALPESYQAEPLGRAFPGTAYKGLTKYFAVEPGSALPEGFREWARLAYENVSSATRETESS